MPLAASNQGPPHTPRAPIRLQKKQRPPPRGYEHRAGSGKRHAYQHGLTDALLKPAADESIPTRNTQTREPPERVADHSSPHARFRIDAGPSDHVNHHHAAPRVGEYQQRSARCPQLSSFLSDNVIFKRQWAQGRTSGGLALRRALNRQWRCTCPTRLR